MNILLFLFIVEIKSTESDKYFENKLFDVSKFNYEGNCSNYFISKPNNERDIIISGVYYASESKWLKQKYQTVMSWEITQKGIPNAKKVVFLYGDEPEEGYCELLKYFGIEVIKIPIDHPKGTFYNAAFVRFLDIENYLKNIEMNLIE